MNRPVNFIISAIRISTYNGNCILRSRTIQRTPRPINTSAICRIRVEGLLQLQLSKLFFFIGNSYLCVQRIIVTAASRYNKAIQRCSCNRCCALSSVPCFPLYFRIIIGKTACRAAGNNILFKLICFIDTQVNHYLAFVSGNEIILIEAGVLFKLHVEIKLTPVCISGGNLSAFKIEQPFVQLHD